MDIETLDIAETLNLVWSDATASLGIPYHTFEHIPHRNQTNSFLHTQPPLQSQTSNRPVFHHNAIEFT